VSLAVARASSQYAASTTSPITTAPAVCSLACWYKPSSIANGTALGIGDLQSTSRYFALGMDGTGKAFFEPTGATALSTGTLTNGAWSHIAGVQASASSRSAYLNGTAGSAQTSTVTSASETLEEVTIGGLQLNGTRTSFAGGEIAECAIWSVALTAAEVLMLSRGVSPLLVRAASLVFYCSCLKAATPEQDIRGGRTLAFGATTKAPTKGASHPPVAGCAPIPLVMPGSTTVAASRTATDSVTITDAAVRNALAEARSASDAVSIGDVALRGGLAEARSSNDTVDAIVDAAIRHLSAPRAGADVVTIADVVDRGLARARAGADAVAVSDLAQRTIATGRAGVDSVTVGDVAERGALALGCMGADVVTIGDAAAREGAVSLRSALDALAVADSPARGVSAARATADALIVADAAERDMLALTRAASDAVTIGDSVTAAVEVVRAGADNVAVTESATRDLEALVRSASDAVGVTDLAVAGRPPVQRFAVDSVTIADDAVREVLARVRVGVEAWTVSDEVSRLPVSWPGVAGDVVTVSDSAAGRGSFGRQAGDVVAIFDAAVIFVAPPPPHYEVVLDDPAASPLTLGIRRARRQLVPRVGEAEVQTRQTSRPSRTVTPR
jgi:hypothetical protein